MNNVFLGQPSEQLKNWILKNYKSECTFICVEQTKELWEDYATFRKTTNPNVDFKVVTSQSIYSEFPFEGSNIKAANPAESIWKYIRKNLNVSNQYYVLCGSFIDGQDYHSLLTFEDGTIQSLENSIPGIYTYSDDESTYLNIKIPSDYFYSCFGNDLTSERHPWWIEEKQSYLNSNTFLDRSLFYPSVIVSRIPFIPYKLNNEIITVKQQIQSLKQKISKIKNNFDGQTNYAFAFSSRGVGVFDKSEINQNDLPDAYNPHKYLDGLPEFLDEEHEEPISDFEFAARLRMTRDISKYTKIDNCLAVWRNNNGQDIGSTEFYNNDYNMLYVKSHGENDSCIYLDLTNEKLLNCSGLCKMLLLPAVCNTGCLDYGVDNYYEEHYTGTLKNSFAQAALANINGGGDVCGIHNTRPGFFANNLDLKIEVANCNDDLSTKIESYLIKELLQNKLSIGLSLKNALFQYFKNHNVFKQDKDYIVGVQEVLIGDPLVKI